MRVLAVDPGKACGLALYRGPSPRAYAADGPVQVPPPPEWQAWIEPWQSAMGSVERWCRDGQLDLIAVERFTISAGTVRKSAEAGWSMGGIGCCQFFAAEYGVPIVLQAPADAMNFVTKGKLVRLGWRTPGPDHADDATRHLVLALVNRKAIDLARLLPAGGTV